MLYTFDILSSSKAKERNNEKLTNCRVKIFNLPFHFWKNLDSNYPGSSPDPPGRVEVKIQNFPTSSEKYKRISREMTN